MKRKYKVNDLFFKRWSNNMAYILGLWFTDGNTDGVSDFSISQHKRDKYILINILKEMGSNNPLHLDKNNYSFRIYSKEIVSDILKLGGCSRKSLVVDFPKIPRKYLSSFIRGLWDGDGSISYNKHAKGYFSYFTSGSKRFIYKFHSVLKDNIIGLKGCICYDCRQMPSGKQTVTYNLKLGINETRRLREFIYKGKDQLRLDRKHNRFVNAGKVNVCCRDKIYLNFNDAKIYVGKLGLKSLSEWKEYCKRGGQTRKYTN